VEDEKNGPGLALVGSQRRLPVAGFFGVLWESGLAELPFLGGLKGIG